MLASGAMSVPLSEIAIPSIAAGLRVLESLVTKAESYATEHGLEPAALLEHRLAADMFTFTDQIQAATDTVRRGLERLSDEEVSSKEDPAPTYAALAQRIRETLDQVRATDATRVNQSEQRAFEVAYSPDMKVPYTGKTFLLSFVLPNFFFHVTTAYGILRNRGLALGKMDYLAPLGAEYKIL